MSFFLFLLELFTLVYVAVTCFRVNSDRRRRKKDKAGDSDG